MMQFDMVQTDKFPTNIVNKSHFKAFSTEIGRLTPIMWDECLPRDQWTCKVSLMAKTAPLITPTMGQIWIYIHGYNIPFRLLWINWEDFRTGFNKLDNSVNTSTPPYLNIHLDTRVTGSLHDYLDLPVGADTVSDAGDQYSILPFFAYQLVWVHYYRKQFIQDIPTTLNGELSDGNITGATATEMQTLRNVPYPNDLFTSCLPNAQLGPSVVLPLGDTAPVEAVMSSTQATNQQVLRETIDNSLEASQTSLTSSAVTALLGANPGGKEVYIDLQNSHVANLANASASTIIDFRRAKALQRYYELSQKGGNRYFEWLKVYYNVIYSNKSAQRPVIFMAQKQLLKVGNVVQQTQVVPGGSQTPMGTETGTALSVGSGGSYSIYTEEDGIIMILASIVPKPMYQKGVPKKFKRFDRLDYHTPHLEHIGEQALTVGEVYSLSNQEENDEAFGYQKRYYSYCYTPDMVAGDFRTSLDTYTLARKFSSEPALNEDFITCQSDEYDRLFAVENPAGEDRIWCSAYFDLKVKRQVAIFSTDKV